MLQLVVPRHSQSVAKWSRALALLSSFLLSGPPLAHALDQALPPYRPKPGVGGVLKAVGSDTMNSAATALAREFTAKYPEVKIEIEGNGSDTAPRALLDGTAQFGLMSRPMTSQELNAFEKAYGYRLGRIRVAVDALLIFVNKENPVRCLSLPQIDRIFSATRQASGGRSLEDWGNLGLAGEWAGRRIALFGRNAASGTYAFFKGQVLYGGDYKAALTQLPTAAAVVDAVAADKAAIGYGGLGRVTPAIRAVPLSVYEGGQCFDASAEAVLSDKYPLARYLYVYTNKKPDEPLDPLRAEFARFVLSKDGQSIVAAAGFYPVSNAEREADLEALGIGPAN